MRELIEFWLFIAFVLLLLLLRLDAYRFGVAEYDDAGREGGWRAWLRRLTFYALGIALVLLIYSIYPQPITVLHLDLGSDRQQALQYGLLYGLGGTIVAFGFAWFRYRRFRLPSARAYPAGLLNSVATAFIDEALFRGVILGLLLWWGWPTALAIAFETILYGLCTRLGAPGRSRAMLLISLGMGAVAGILVVETLGIGAAVLGAAITRFSIFLATGHAGSVRPAGWEPEEVAAWALPPRGWDIVGEGGIPDTMTDPGLGPQLPYAGPYGGRGTPYPGQPGPYAGQGGYPVQGGYPTQGGYSGQGGPSAGEAGYQGQGAPYAGQGGYPVQGGYPTQGGYAGPGGPAYPDPGGHAAPGAYDQPGDPEPGPWGPAPGGRPGPMTDADDSYAPQPPTGGPGSHG